MGWTIRFVSAKAEKEIDALSSDLKAKFLHIADLLISFGPHEVGMPHIRPLEGKIWEMRLKGRHTIGRSLYCLVKDQKIVILHTFIKKTEKTPVKALEIARQRLKELSHDHL